MDPARKLVHDEERQKVSRMGVFPLYPLEMTHYSTFQVLSDK
jgi:hypothetical protein